MTDIMKKLWDAPDVNSDREKCICGEPRRGRECQCGYSALPEQVNTLVSHTNFLVSQLHSAKRALDEIKWLRKPGGNPTKYQETVEVIASNAIRDIKKALTDTEHLEQHGPCTCSDHECGECMRPTLSQILAADAIHQNNREYEELRAIIDNGSESMTHEEAVKELKRLMMEDEERSKAGPQ